MAANCGFESMTQLLRDRMVTGTKIAKICSYRYRSCRREYGHTNKRCLLSLNWVMWRRERKSSQEMSHLSAVAGLKAADSLVGATKNAASLYLIIHMHIVKRRIILLSNAQQKARCLLSKRCRHWKRRSWDGDPRYIKGSFRSWCNLLNGHWGWMQSFAFGCLQEGYKRSTLEFPQCTRQVSPGISLWRWATHRGQSHSICLPQKKPAHKIKVTVVRGRGYELILSNRRCWKWIW